MNIDQKQYLNITVIKKLCLLLALLVTQTAICDPIPEEDPATNTALQNTNLWTGYYTGVTLGAIINQSRVVAKQGELFTAPEPTIQNISSTKFIPGLNVGYLNQTASGWVRGIELDLSYPDGVGSNNPNCVPSCTLFDKFTIKNRVQGAVLLRFGHDFYNGLLPYATGGVSIADTAISYTNSVQPPDSYTANSVMAGWILGAGVEYRTHSKFSVRAEYLYTDYDKNLNLGLPVIQNSYDPNGMASANLISHTARVAVMYWF
ncbi:outer membrane beta-barrel protein [Methylomonas sp. AM2-LC]|uniref:outer membrane protein n=1 Tax=Methylomonas sp. AM2-LC TaxID=3153301 RepID=UPI00326460F3